MLHEGGQHMQYKHVPNSDRAASEALIRFPLSPHQLLMSPLHWWRTRRPKSFNRSDVKIIRAYLLRIQIIDDDDWMRAVTGNPAAAIGVAVRQLKACGMKSPVVDAAVSAVLCCAIEGDAAAPCLILSALRRRSKIDPLSHKLISRWVTARF